MPRQREVAEKILKRNPLFQTQPLEVGILIGHEYNAKT
jgi:hypothetical protein